MKSLLGGVLDRISNRSGDGWNNTTYNRTPSAGFGRQSKDIAGIEAYGSVSTLFSIVSLIANSTGSTKWRLYRGKVDGRRVKGPVAEDRQEIVSHVALDAWSKPTPIPYITQSFFLETCQQHVDLVGEARILVARNRLSSMPLELWPIRPDKIEPIPNDDDFLVGYIYTGPNGEKIPLGVEDVISVLMPNPDNMYRGLGPVQSLLVDLDSVKYAGQFNRNFFLNDATPGGVIEMENRLSDSEWNEFQERWRYGHQGVSNAHRVALLESGGKWKDRQFTMRDMQFSELRNISREIIREAFRISPHMLGIEETVNRATAESSEDVFARWVLKPRLDRWKDALNEQLLPLFGSSGTNMEFDFDDPSLEDSEANDQRLESKARAAKLLIEAGGQYDSVLENVGLPKIEFDQETVDRETKAKEDAAKALQNGQKNGSGQIPSSSEESNGDKGKPSEESMRALLTLGGSR